jgi:peptidoglycan hydrolase-like protein with peptidoglycan-binding domain
MSLTISKTAKLIAGVVGFAMVLGFVAAPSAAKAQTTDLASLQALVASLTAQIAALSGGGSMTTPAVPAGPFTLGSTGASVKWVQEYAMSKGCPIPAGATAYFGTQTQAAVACVQNMLGVTPATGYWGASTVAAVNASMMAPKPPVNNNDDDNDDDNSSSNGPLEGGAGSITVDDSSKYSNEEIGEGDENVEVLQFSVEADDDSDVLVSSIKVELAQTNGADSQDLDDYIEVVSVWFNGEMVGEEDVDGFSENSDIYTRYISLEDSIVRAGEEEDFVIAVTAVNSLDSGDIDSDVWTVDVLNVRFEDADGVVSTESVDGNNLEQNFDFASFASANDVELKAKKDSGSPEEGTVIGKDDDDFDADLLVFTLEAEGSDVEVHDLVVALSSVNGVVTDMASDLMLSCDGEEWSENAAASVTFDDLDFTIDEGDKMECIVSATMNEIDGTTFEEGDDLKAVLTVGSTDAEDESGEDVQGSDLTGSANGEQQFFYSEGLIISDITTDSEITFTANDNGEESVGTYTIEFDVTANDTDVYLDKTAQASSTPYNTIGAGAVYTIYSAGAGVESASSTAYECISNCGETSDNNSNKFYIEEGETERYRLTVTLTGDDAPLTDNFKVWLNYVNWTTSATNDDLAAEYFSSNLGEDSDADAGYLSLISQ